MLSSHLFIDLPFGLLVKGILFEYFLSRSGIWHSVYVAEPA